MTAAEIRSAVLETLGDIAPEVDLPALDPEQTFADQFDFDSVDCLNLVQGLEGSLNVDIPEGDCPKLASLNSAVNYLLEKKKAAPTPE